MKAQKDITRAKIAITDEQADLLAREQAKNKLLSQCIENGTQFNFNVPVSSQKDVHLMFSKIQKLSEKDKLTIMRREVKFKKMMFSELPPDFVLFKQQNITAAKMFQNLLALHAVDPAHQETISMEDIYDVTDTVATLLALDLTTTKAKRSGKLGQQSDLGALVDLEWPLCEEEFFTALEEEGWRVCSSFSQDETSNTLKAHQLEPIKTRAKDDAGRTYWIYSEDEKVETYEQKNVLTVRPSISLAKNIKQKDPVFSFLNREVIDGMCASLYN